MFHNRRKVKEPENRPFPFTFHPYNFISKALSQGGDMIKFRPNPVWVGIGLYKKRKRVTSLGIASFDVYSTMRGILLAEIGIVEELCPNNKEGLLGSFLFNFKGVEHTVSVSLKIDSKGFEILSLKITPTTKG